MNLKKTILSCCCFILSLNGIAQSQAYLKIDSNISMLLPKDTAQKIIGELKCITANMDSGTIVVIISANKGENMVPADNETDLLNDFNGIQEGALESLKAKVVFEKFGVISNVKSKNVLQQLKVWKI